MNDVVVQEPNTAGKAAWICLAVAWLCFLLPMPGLGFAGLGLNFAAFVLAIVAMGKRGAMGGLFQLLASIIVSPFVYVIGLLIFVGSMSGGGHLQDWMKDHGKFDDRGHGSRRHDAAEEANQAANANAATSATHIAAIEAMADAASVAPPVNASVMPPAASTTR